MHGMKKEQKLQLRVEGIAKIDMEGIAKIQVSNGNKCIEIKKNNRKPRNCEFEVLFGACKRCKVKNLFYWGKIRIVIDYLLKTAARA